MLKLVVNGSEPLKMAHLVLRATVSPTVDTRKLRVALDLKDSSEVPMSQLSNIFVIRNTVENVGVSGSANEGPDKYLSCRSPPRPLRRYPSSGDN